MRPDRVGLPRRRLPTTRSSSWEIGQSETSVWYGQAASPQHPASARLDAVQDLRDEPRLADAGLARDEEG